MKHTTSLAKLPPMLVEQTSMGYWPLLHYTADFSEALSGGGHALVAWRHRVAEPLHKDSYAAASTFIQLWQQLQLAQCNFVRPSTAPNSSCQLLLIDGSTSEAQLQHMLQSAFERPEPVVCLASSHESDQQRLAQLQQYWQQSAVSGSEQSQLQWLFNPVHTSELMASASRVYTVRSILATEALLWQKELHCAADSVFAGTVYSHGLFAGQSQQQVSLQQWIHHAILTGQQARHPETGLTSSFAELMQWAGLQHDMRCRLPAQLYAYGFSRFWRKTLCRFVQGSEVTFLNKKNQLPKQGTLLCWGRRALPSVHAGLNLIRLEDGFIRSVGLGAQFAEPMSWIMDQRGLYFDATQPSDLEAMLQSIELTTKQRQRAEALQQRICQQGITKYNVGQQQWQAGCNTKRLILVAGQVETDASIEYGAHRIRSNIELLQQVRQDNPDAWVIYKPHPDVHSGARAAGQNEQQAEQYCDELVVDASMSVLLDVVDEVHIITSLTGFEALLRGKKVVCYGWPFYAGWGLTRDMAPQPRRQRKLDVATLVYATLIAYPRYISLVTGGYSSPEQVLNELEQLRNQPLTVWTSCQLFCRKGVRVVLNALFGKK